MELYNTLFEILKAGMFSDGISPKTRELFKDKEVLKELFKRAKKHDLAHLLAYSLDKTGLSDTDSELKEKCSKLQFIAVYRYENIKHELKRICDTLEEGGIHFIVLKGSVLRRYYPEPWMRTSCDIDILVKEDISEKARDLLVERLGYTFVVKGAHDYHLSSPGNVNLELHYTLLGEDSISDTADALLEEVWENTDAYGDYKYGYEMNRNMFLYYHIIHLAKHIKNGGCGIKPFLDLYVMQEKCGIDIPDNGLIKKGGIEKVSLAAVKLANIYFGKDEHNEQTAAISQFVLDGGVYGNKENNVVMKRTQKGGKLRYVMSRIYLPYDVIKFRYPEIEGKKWLTVPYQFRRWFDTLFRGGAQTAFREVRINSDISAENVEDARRILDDLGL